MDIFILQNVHFLIISIKLMDDFYFLFFIHIYSTDVITLGFVFTNFVPSTFLSECVKEAIYIYHHFLQNKHILPWYQYNLPYLFLVPLQALQILHTFR